MSTQGTVLIVEDILSSLQNYVEWLTDAGFTVKGVQLADEALKVLDNFDPDVMLIDVALPDMNGIRLCKKIRERPGYSAQNAKYIVMMSDVYTSSLNVGEGLNKGADFYQTRKPESEHELVSTVRALMRKLPDVSEDNLWEDSLWLGVDQWLAISRHHNEIRIGSKTQNIPRAQYYILRHLYKNFDKPCSAADLCESAYIGGSALEKDMSELRKIIKDSLVECSLELSVWSYLPRKSDRGYALRKPSKQST